MTHIIRVNTRIIYSGDKRGYMSQANEFDPELKSPFKVEDLSAIAKISIDTIRFYQARGLLDPPARTGRQALYDNSHLRRLEEIRDLQKSGLSLNTIRRIFNKDVQEADKALFSALTKPAETNHSYLTIDELSDKTSIPIPLLQSLVSEGLIPPVRLDGREVFPPSDVSMAKAGLALLESGIPLSDLLELAKRHHQATRASATRAIDLFDRYVRNPIVSNKDSREISQKLVEAFNQLLPAAVALVAGHFERTLLALAQTHLEHVGAESEIKTVREIITNPDPNATRETD